MTLQSLLERRVSRSALRRGVSDSGTRATDWLRYLDDSECRVLGGLILLGLPAGLAKAPCSFDRSWRTGVSEVRAPMPRGGRSLEERRCSLPCPAMPSSAEPFEADLTQSDARGTSLSPETAGLPSPGTPSVPHTRCCERYDRPSDGEDQPRHAEDRSSVCEEPDRHNGGRDRDRRPGGDKHPGPYRVSEPVACPPGHADLRGGGASSLRSMTPSSPRSSRTRRTTGAGERMTSRVPSDTALWCA